MDARSDEYVFELVGGAVCLDFANTVSSYLAPAGQLVDHMTDYPSLLSWAHQAGLIDDATLARLRRVAVRHAGEVGRVLERAHELRAAVYAAFASAARGKRAPADALATLSGFHAGTSARQRLVARTSAGTTAYELECSCEEDALDQMLWPVARSAIELLTSERHTRVRVCEAASQETCTWLFVDESKNHSRRWCSMRDCGNRAKVRRHYQRKKRDAS